MQRPESGLPETMGQVYWQAWRDVERLATLRQEGAITAAEVRTARAQLAAGKRQRSQALVDGRAAIQSLQTRRASLLAAREGLEVEVPSVLPWLR